MARRSTTRPLSGRTPSRSDYIAQHQRARIIKALAEETSANGYNSVTVAAVVKRAGIARNVFYENFGSKEDCFLQTQRYATENAFDRVSDAAAKSTEWPRQVEAGVRAFLRYVSEEPALARTCMVEALTAGPRSYQRHEESLQIFVDLFRTGRNASLQGEDLPETLEEAIIGGLFWIVYHRLVAGDVEDLEGLAPEVVEFILAPYLGAEAAHAASEERLGATDSRGQTETTGHGSDADVVGDAGS